MPDDTISLVNFLLGSLYVLGLYGAFMAGSLYLRTPLAGPVSQPRNIITRFPIATVALFVAVGIPSLIQFFEPAVLVLLQRDFTRFMLGEWWRLVTPLFVQDGSTAGTFFNLISLLLIGTLAEQFWGSLPVLLIFFSGGSMGELAGFAWQNGYGMFSIGFSQIDSARDYIGRQAEHHHEVSFQDEFRQFLKRYQVEFDERYVWD